MRGYLRRTTRLARLAFLLVSFGARASVADEESASTAERPVVQMVVTGESRTTKELEIVVRELVARLPVKLEWSLSSGIDPREVLAPRAEDKHVIARAWIDLADPSRARIYVTNSGSERFIVRFIPERHGYDDVAREALGEILESSVAAFLTGGDVGITRENAAREVEREGVAVPPPAPSPPRPSPPPPAPPSPPNARAGVVVGYDATAWSRGPVFVHGPLLAFELALPSRNAIRFASWASVAYRAPLFWDGPTIGVRLDGGATRLALGVEAELSKRFVIRALAGGGVDVIHVGPYAESASALAGSAFWTVAPIASAMLNIEAQLTGRFGAILGAGADLDLSLTRYDVLHASGPAPILTPSTVRPAAFIGFVIALEGTRLR